MKTKITQDEWDELDLPWSYVDRVFTHSSRWAKHYDVIFEWDGLFWSVSYGFGSTEFQEDQSPFDYVDAVEVTQVHKVPVTVEQWKPVEA